MQRNADPVTIDHIIDLRKEINRLEKELEDYKRVHQTILERQRQLINEVHDLRGQLYSVYQSQISNPGH